jgi:hypothetical protein
VRAVAAGFRQNQAALFVICHQHGTQPRQPLEDGEAGFVPLNCRVGERPANIGLNNDVDLGQAGDRAGDRVQFVACELPAFDVGRAIDDVLGLATPGDARVPTAGSRLNARRSSDAQRIATSSIDDGWGQGVRHLALRSFPPRVPATRLPPQPPRGRT